MDTPSVRIEAPAANFWTDIGTNGRLLTPPLADRLGDDVSTPLLLH